MKQDKVEQFFLYEGKKKHGYIWCPKSYVPSRVKDLGLIPISRCGNRVEVKSKTIGQE